LVGVVDPHDAYAHHHVPEGLLFAVEHDVPEELRAALVARYERSRPTGPSR
jgi:hypothetical protein